MHSCRIWKVRVTKSPHFVTSAGQYYTDEGLAFLWYFLIVTASWSFMSLDGVYLLIWLISGSWQIAAIGTAS
jgi:hypothetical protein